jgi:hypothetical protein
VLFVAEAAQTLCRNADYEIPFLKKQAAKCQQQLADLERRKADAHKSASAAAADFKQASAEWGVEVCVWGVGGWVGWGGGGGLEGRRQPAVDTANVRTAWLLLL